MNSVNEYCPICGKRSSFLLENSAGYNIRKCESCGHVFVANPPSRDEVEGFYADFSYFEDNYNHQGITAIEGAEQWKDWLGARLGAIDSYLPGEFHDGARLEVLEIGCLEGRVLAALRDRGHAVRGCDINPVVVSAGSELLDLDLESADFLDCEYPSGAFDLIVSFHSFEHMVDPRAALAKATDLLKPGGCVLLELPANDLEYENLHHLHFFTAESITAMFESLLGNCEIHANCYETAEGITMGSVYAVGRKATSA